MTIILITPAPIICPSDITKDSSCVAIRPTMKYPKF